LEIREEVTKSDLNKELGRGMAYKGEQMGETNWGV
jgi:hypothetical protein